MRKEILLSGDAFILMDVCLSNIDYNTFMVRNSNEFMGEESLSQITGFEIPYLRCLIEELWKKRLLADVKVNGNSFYVVNGMRLGFEESEFRDNCFFAWVFWLEDKSRKETSKRRHLRKERLINDFTDDVRTSVLETFGNRCALTGKTVDLQMDHVIPIAVGHGGTTKANMLPIWQRINSSKCSRNIFEWYKVNGERFGVVPELFDRAIDYLARLNEMTVDQYREYVYWCHENPSDILTKESV
jgi:hypothetical protein